MATRVVGDERRGQDDDEGRGDEVRVVQIENAYFEKLKARIAAGTVVVDTLASISATGEPDKPKGPGFVIYGDDGRPID